MKTFKIIYSAVLIVLFFLCLYMLHTTELKILTSQFTGDENILAVYQDQKTCLLYVAGLALVLSVITFFTVKSN